MMRSSDAGHLGFGVLLRRYRAAAGLTQEDLAERAQVSARAISDLERGVYRVPRRDTLALLVEALQLTPQERTVLEAAAQRRSEVVAAHAPTDGALLARSARPPFIGRARELALLEQHLAGTGRPLLLLAGEPGIGKSRLLQEATQRAVAQGLCALEGGCQRRGGQEPYAPLLNALEHFVDQRSPTQRRADLQGCAWLVRVLPELARMVGDAPAPGLLPLEQERRLIGRAVLRFLTNVAGPAGTLLVLDDLQWAGRDALDLLVTLVRSAAQVPLHVVGAYRETEVPPDAPLAHLLADLAHAGLVTHHALAPLSPTEVEHLLDVLLADVDGPEATVRERVIQRTGGVPFFVVSCAQTLRLGDGRERADDAVPWDVTQSVRQRVALLPEAAREVLGTAAVAGRAVRLDLLRSMLDQPEEVILAALDAAAEARLLVEDAQGYHFAHDVIREVVEANVGRARRLVLHRRIAEGLEGRPGEPPIEQLAYHYGRSDAANKALVYLEQAGDKARTQAAHAAAEDYYRKLVDRLEEWSRWREVARVCEKLGGVLETAVRYDAALTVLARAAELYQAAGEREGLLRTKAKIGWVHAIKGTPAAGLDLLQPLVATSALQEPSSGLAALFLALSSLYFHSARYRECLAASGRAAELARASGDEGMLARATWERGNVLQILGQVDDALPVMEEGLSLTEAVGDLVYHVIALDGLAEAYLRRGEFSTSHNYLARGLEVAERTGNVVIVAYLRGLRGAVAFFQGEWSQARRTLEQAVALFRQVGESHMCAYILSALGWLCLAEGRWDEAVRYLDEATAMAAPSHDLQALRWAGGALAEHALLAGQPDVGHARLLPLLDRPGLHEHDVTPLLAVLAWTHLSEGDITRAGEVARQARVRAHRQHNRLALVEALRVEAMVVTHQERWGEAIQALEEGLTLTQRMPYPYAEGRLLHVYGQMHAQKGELGPARERLEAALAIFRRLGACKDAEQEEQAIATLQRP